MFNKRKAIIDILAIHRAKGDEAERKKIEMKLNCLATELLMLFLDENQLKELKKKEEESNTGEP